MIIICPNCESKFRVAKGAIGSNGRFVRCSSCSHEWVAHANAVLLPQKSVVKEGKLKPSADKKNISPETPINKKPVANKIYDEFSFRYVFYFLAFISVIALLGLNLIIHREFLVQEVPWLQEVYNELHLYSNAALKLESVQVHESDGVGEDEPLITLEVESAIKNISNLPQELSHVRFTVYNEEKKNLGTLTLSFDKIIAPGESYKIEGKLNQVPHDSKYMVVDFGNMLDLYFRDTDYINIHRP